MQTLDAFGNIDGYDDLKEIVKRALNAPDSYNLLFCGPPANSKTQFLQSIMEIRKDAVYFDATNMTSKILDVSIERREKTHHHLNR